MLRQRAGANASRPSSGKNRWTAELPSLKAGKTPDELVVSSGEETIRRKNILVSDVWLCAGQSNMEMHFSAPFLPRMPCDLPDFVKPGDWPTIRHLRIGTGSAGSPQTRLPDSGKAGHEWSVCNADTYKKFTAVGFFFADTVSKEVGVPIGLINVSMGNTDIASWLAPDGIKALISGWREAWGRSDIPFYYAQLPSNAEKRSWAPTREAQRMALTLPNTGMAVLTDAGDNKAEWPGSLHPRNKFRVGQRLALWALAKDYGKNDLVYCGPLFKAAEFLDGKVVIHFDHVGSGLVAAKKESSNSIEPPKPVADLAGFEIAGQDGKWVAAEAVIRDNKVVLSGMGMDTTTRQPVTP